MPRGKKSTIKVSRPSAAFIQLALDCLNLELVKQQYVSAVYLLTGSISETARICQVSTNTVYHYLGHTPKVAYTYRPKKT
jgi:predicted transcriptional regulator YheO